MRIFPLVLGDGERHQSSTSTKDFGRPGSSRTSLASCWPSHRRNSWQRWSKRCCARSRRRWQAGRSAMTKIAADHLGRSAFVYIRQSTADQLLHNLESRRQYGLAERARLLGWTMVEVIDDDLGRSGGGINRPGFERLLAAICEGRVGSVFAIEASRLAHNSRDWHTPIEV